MRDIDPAQCMHTRQRTPVCVYYKWKKKLIWKLCCDLRRSVQPRRRLSISFYRFVMAALQIRVLFIPRVCVQLLIQIEKNSERRCARECFVIRSERWSVCSGRAARSPICAEWVQLWWILTSINNPLLDIHTHIYTSFALTDWLARERPVCIWASATVYMRLFVS